MSRRLVLAVLTVVLLPLGMILTSAAAGAATSTPACSGDITIGQFSFNPASVPAGQTSTLSLSAQNCTGQTVAGQTIWYGRYTGADGGIPPGCPVIDPVAQPYTIAPQGTYTASRQDGDTFTTCQATGLEITVEFTENNATGVVAEATADLTIVQPTPSPSPSTLGCHVSYTPSNWQGGFTASVTVSNTSAVAVNGWTLAFAFGGDEEITNAWNATVSQAGPDVSAASMSYNASIPPGGSQSFGFQGTWSASDAPPASFSVNGTACS